MKFSEKIVFMRKKRGISQDRLAQKMGVSRQTIYKWEADLNTPEFKKIERLAEILDISYDLLLDDSIDLEEHFNADSEKANIENEQSKKQDDINKDNIESIKEQKDRPSKKLLIGLAVGIVCIVTIIIAVALIRSYLNIDANTDLPLNTNTDTDVTVDNNTDTDLDTDLDTDTDTDLDTDTDIDNVVEEIRVLFDVNGGSMSNVVLSLNKGEIISMLPVPTRDNYTFIGWFTSEDIKISDGDTLDKSVTLIAKWKINQAVVNFNPLGGKVDEEKRNVEFGEKIGTLPIPTRENYEFLYWHFNDIRINEDTIIDRDITFYAKWQEITDKATITLNANGGNVSIQAIEVQKGAFVFNKLPIPTHSEGLDFAGWFDERGVKVTEITKISKDTTLIAYYGQLEICPYTNEEHIYGLWKYDRVEPTCTQNGYAYRLCYNCFYENRQITQNAQGHDFPEWTYGVMQQTRQCTRCLLEEKIEYKNLSDRIENTAITGNVTQPDSWNGLYDNDWYDDTGIFASCGGEFTVEIKFFEPTMVDYVFAKLTGTNDKYILSVMYEGDTEYTIIADNGSVGDEVQKFQINGVIASAKFYLPTSQKYISWEEIAFAKIPEGEAE